MHNIAQGNQNNNLLQGNIDNTWLHWKLLHLILTSKTSAFNFNIKNFCISFQRQQMTTYDFIENFCISFQRQQMTTYDFIENFCILF